MSFLNALNWAPLEKAGCQKNDYCDDNDVDEDFSSSIFGLLMLMKILGEFDLG